MYNNRNQRPQSDNAAEFQQFHMAYPPQNRYPGTSSSSNLPPPCRNIQPNNNPFFNRPPPVRNIQPSYDEQSQVAHQRLPVEMSQKHHVENTYYMSLPQKNQKEAEHTTFREEAQRNSHVQKPGPNQRPPQVGTPPNYQGDVGLFHQTNTFKFQGGVPPNHQQLQGVSLPNQLQGRIPSTQQFQGGMQPKHKHLQGDTLPNQQLQGGIPSNQQQFQGGMPPNIQQSQTQLPFNPQHFHLRPPNYQQLCHGESQGHPHTQGISSLNLPPPGFSPHMNQPPPDEPPFNPLKPPPKSEPKYNFQKHIPPPTEAFFSANLPPPGFLMPSMPIAKGPPPVMARPLTTQFQQSDQTKSSLFQEPLSQKVLGSQLISQWLQKNEQSRKGKNKEKTQNTSNGKDAVTLHKQVQSLAEMKAEIMWFRKSINEMELVLSEADNSAWESKLNELEKRKNQLKTILSVINSTCSVEMQNNFKRNKKKRDRLKRARQMKYEDLQRRKEEINLKSASIDKWQQAIVKQMKDKDKNEKRKAAADKTLGKVSKDIQDANRLMETMKALEKLRLIRRDAAEKRGDTELGEPRESFEQKITDMTRLVEAQLEAYRAEEARLKVIIKSEVEEDDRQIAEKQRNAEYLKQKAEEEELETMLFGAKDEVDESHPMYPYAQYYNQAQHNLPSFIQIRQSWDACLVPPHTPGGSGIPAMWVTPEEPGSLAWAKLLM